MVLHVSVDDVGRSYLQIRSQSQIIEDVEHYCACAARLPVLCHSTVERERVVEIVPTFAEGYDLSDQRLRRSHSPENTLIREIKFQTRFRHALRTRE